MPPVSVDPMLREMELALIEDPLRQCEPQTKWFILKR
jgi:hypothetical protein